MQLPESALLVVMFRIMTTALQRFAIIIIVGIFQIGRHETLS
jgi:hypothetical protein